MFHYIKFKLELCLLWSILYDKSFEMTPMGTRGVIIIALLHPYMSMTSFFWVCLFELKYIGIEYIERIQWVVENEDQRLILKNEHQITFPF